jgi:hypothetical protein
VKNPPFLVHTLSVRLPDAEFGALVDRARKESRTLSNFVRLLLMNAQKVGRAIWRAPAHGLGCHTLKVPEDVCRVRFSGEQVANSDHIGTTRRGEMVILHWDRSGFLISVELVSDHKPCQQMPATSGIAVCERRELS